MNTPSLIVRGGLFAPIATLLAFLCGACVLTGRASAQVLPDISEFCDFPNANSPRTLGTLQPGSTKIFGSINASASVLNGPVIGDAADSFTFTIPAGTRLDVIIGRVFTYSATGSATGGRITTDTPNVNTWTFSGAATNPNLLNGGVAPAGTYTFTVSTDLTPSATGGSNSFFFELVFFVTNCSAVTPVLVPTMTDCGPQFTVMLPNVSGFRGVLVERSSTPSGPANNQWQLSLNGSTTFTDTSVVPGATYFYRAQWNNSTPCGSPSAYSPDVSVTIPSSVPAPTVRVAERSTAVLSAGAFASPPYAWYRGGQSPTGPGATLVTDGGRISGATTATLTIQNAGTPDADVYWCVGGCPGASPRAVSLFVAEGCRADFDDSGVLAPQDIFDFLNAWFIGCP